MLQVSKETQDFFDSVNWDEPAQFDHSKDNFMEAVGLPTLTKEVVSDVVDAIIPVILCSSTRSEITEKVLGLVHQWTATTRSITKHEVFIAWCVVKWQDIARELLSKPKEK